MQKVSLSEFNCSFLISCILYASFILNVLLNFFGHGNERVFNIYWVLCRCLQEWNFIMFSKFHSLFITNFSALFHIALIAHQYFAYSSICKSTKTFKHLYVCLPFDFMHPLSDIIEWVSICHIINNNNSMSTYNNKNWLLFTIFTSIVARCQSSEPFLTCSVPLYYKNHLDIAQSLFKYRLMVG